MNADPSLLRATDLAVAAVLVGCGVVAWRWNRSVSVLLGATAVTWLLANRWEVTLFWHRALLVHLVLAYPSWRPSSRLAGGVVAAMYAVCVLWPAVLIDDRANVLGGVVVVAAGCWNARSAGGRTRHQRHIALAAAVCVGTVLVLGGVAELVGEGVVGDGHLLAYEGMVVMAAGVLTAGLRPPSVEDLAGVVIELGDTPADALREAISRATRDPEVRVGYWHGDLAAYLDVDGAVIDPTMLGPERAAVDVTFAGQSLAVVVLDPVLARDPKLVQSVQVATRTVVENARRTADVVRRVGELEDSRRRLVEAADDERAVLEEELRSGVLASITELAADVRRLAERIPSPHLARAAEHLVRTADELGDVASGLRPRDLENGLGAALAGLAADSPVPVHVAGEIGDLPAHVELTVWYLCSEALANAAKHARASRVTVELQRSDDRLRVSICDDGAGGAEIREQGGLSGLRDRVTSCGGHLELTSGASGTTLVAELPLDDQQAYRPAT